jgi:hypothetical protein
MSCCARAEEERVSRLQSVAEEREAFIKKQREEAAKAEELRRVEVRVHMGVCVGLFSLSWWTRTLAGPCEPVHHACAHACANAHAHCHAIKPTVFLLRTPGGDEDPGQDYQR